MQWLVDSVIETWQGLYPNLDQIETIAPDFHRIIVGDGTRWVGSRFEGILAAYPRFVDAGNKADPDFDRDDFTRDGNDYRIDLSALIPTGTSAVLFYLRMRNNGIQKWARFKNPDYAGDDNINQSLTQIATVLIGNDFISSVNSDRELNYAFVSGGWTSIELTVKGWFF